MVHDVECGDAYTPVILEPLAQVAPCFARAANKTYVARGGGAQRSSSPQLHLYYFDPRRPTEQNAMVASYVGLCGRELEAVVTDLATTRRCAALVLGASLAEVALMSGADLLPFTAPLPHGDVVALRVEDPASAPFLASVHASGWSNLSSREELWVCNESLVALPGAIGIQCSLLKRLRIVGVQIRTLPPEINRLNVLEELGVSGTLLEEMPELILMSHLTKLDLSRNRLRCLPDGPSGLQTLCAPGNHIESGGDMGRFRALVSLDVSGNCLKRLRSSVILGDLRMFAARLNADLKDISNNILSPVVYSDLGGTAIKRMPWRECPTLTTALLRRARVRFDGFRAHMLVHLDVRSSSPWGIARVR